MPTLRAHKNGNGTGSTDRQFHLYFDLPSLTSRNPFELHISQLDVVPRHGTLAHPENRLRSRLTVNCGRKCVRAFYGKGRTSKYEWCGNTAECLHSNA